MSPRRRRVLAAALVPLAGCSGRLGLDGDDEEPRCRTGNPTVTDHAVRMLQQPEDDYEINPEVDLPSVGVVADEDDPGLLLFGSITGSDSCILATVTGTTYDRFDGTLTVEVGPADSEATERFGGCDGAVTTATYRCWVEFAEPAFPETVALRTSDTEGTRTEELPVPFCRTDG